MRFSKVEDTHFPVNRHLRMKDKLVDLTSPKVMGIVNITTDSFYANSHISSDKQLLEQAEKMISEGAEILDIGAYSSRPGATEVPIELEIDRIASSVHLIRKEFSDIILSIDTFRSAVAEAGIDAGADLINDISGGLIDHKMAETVGKLKVPYILMHMRGTPATMMENTNYDNLFNSISLYFSERIAYFTEQGVNDIIIDPGFGFSKTTEQNYNLLQNLDQLHFLGKPILVGISRKSMIYSKLNCSSNEALNGTTALNTIALQKGASILRVHDVKEAKEIISLLS